MIKCMVLNFNQSVAEELYFLWNAISKTYATVRLFTGGQAFTEHKGHSNKRTALKGLLRFLDSQRNFT